MKTIRPLSIRPITILFTLLFTLFATLIFASGVEFKLKVNTDQPEVEKAQFENYDNVTIKNGYLEIGLYSDYILAQKAKNDIKTLGFDNLEIIAYFHKHEISLDDAFTLMDNRNAQDEHNLGYILTEEQMEFELAQVENHMFFYTIQVGLYTEQSVDDFFDFPKQVDERVTNKGYFRYTFGEFSTMQDAEDALKMIKEYGLASAQVIAYDNLERIPVSVAMEREQDMLETALAQTK